LDAYDEWPPPGWMAMLADELEMVEDVVAQIDDIAGALPENFTWRELVTEVRGHRSLAKVIESAMNGPRYTTQEVWERLKPPRRDVPGLFT
jgi:hypothetical protein